MMKIPVHNLQAAVLLLTPYLMSLLAPGTPAQIVKIRPGQPTAAIVKENRARPRALSQAEKLQRANQILESKGKKVSSLESPIFLSAATAYAKDKAAFFLFDVTETQVYSNGYGEVHFAGYSPSSNAFPRVVLYFQAPFAGNYFVDFTVEGSSTATFTLDGDSIVTSTGKDAQQHIVLVAEAKQPAQYIVVGLYANKDWKFYSCEISQIK